MMHGAHSAGLNAAIAVHGALTTARQEALARAAAARDAHINQLLAAQVLDLRRRLAAAEAARDDLARALARR